MFSTWEKGVGAIMNLPIRELIFEQDAWANLQKDIWNENYVDAYLVHANRREPVQVRYRGGHTRNYPKKSYEMKRRAGTIHFNAEYDDPSLIRNALSFRFFESIGVDSPTANHCLLKINEEIQGIYLEIEGVDARFFQRRRLPVRGLFYAANDDANFSLFDANQSLKRSLLAGYQRILGGRAVSPQLERFIFRVNTMELRPLNRYLQRTLDIENYIRWLAGAVCTGNYDGFHQNYAIYEYDPPQPVYRIIPWDYEGTWGRNCYGERCDTNLVRAIGYNTLTKKLLSHPPHLKFYRDTLNEILESQFNVYHLEPRINAVIKTIRPYIESDKTLRWKTSEFDSESEVIAQYIKERREHLLQASKMLS